MMIALVSTIMGIGVSPILLQQQSAYSFRGGGDTTFSRAAAPIATSRDNVYIAWWTNKTGNNYPLLEIIICSPSKLPTSLYNPQVVS